MSLLRPLLVGFMDWVLWSHHGSSLRAAGRSIFSDFKNLRVRICVFGLLSQCVVESLLVLIANEWCVR